MRSELSRANVEPLNTIPLQQFLNAVKAAEQSRAREVKLDIATAKNLAFTLGHCYELAYMVT